MKITIGQNEIEAAVKTYILSIMTLAAGANIDVDFSATRGPDGLTANINVMPPDVAEKAKEEQVAQTREPEQVTGSAAGDAGKATTRKPRTLAVEQKVPETTAAAQQEEVATTAQAKVEEVTSEQQASSGDHDDAVDATLDAAAMAGTGFPGFESENKQEELVPEKVETVSNEAGSTSAEAQPSTRKSLFGGLGRPSNH